MVDQCTSSLKVKVLYHRKCYTDYGILVCTRAYNRLFGAQPLLAKILKHGCFFVDPPIAVGLFPSIYMIGQLDQRSLLVMRHCVCS